VLATSLVILRIGVLEIDPRFIDAGNRRDFEIAGQRVLTKGSSCSSCSGAGVPLKSPPNFVQHRNRCVLRYCVAHRVAWRYGGDSSPCVGRELDRETLDCYCRLSASTTANLKFGFSSSSLRRPIVLIIRADDESILFKDALLRLNLNCHRCFVDRR